MFAGEKERLSAKRNSEKLKRITNCEKEATAREERKEKRKRQRTKRACRQRRCLAA